MFDSLPPLPFERRSALATAEELSGLVDYMQKVIIDYGSGAADLGLVLDADGVERVLLCLELAVQGKEWNLREGADEREFFLHGLYFELGERRSSIREKQGAQTKPISDDIWLQLLGELRRRMAL